MDVYITWDADNLGQLVGRARLQDDVEEVRRVAQRVDQGNLIWRSWVESLGGSLIEMGGDEGAAVVPADHLDELEGIRGQYAGKVGASVSVGIGMRLSEASKALLAAKLTGKNQSKFYTEETDQIIAEAEKNKPDAIEKIRAEYLNKATPAMHPGAYAGASPPSQPTVQKPVASQGEHSEGQAINDLVEGSAAPAPPEQTHAAQDFERQLHEEAWKGEEEDMQASAQKHTNLEQIKAQLVQAIQVLKAQAPVLEQMRQVAPQAYQAVTGLATAVIGLAKELSPAAPQEDSLETGMAKAERERPQELVHYSTTPGLKAIDVQHMGTGAPSAEYKQGRPGVARAYFYRAGTPPEPIVVQGAKARYSAVLDPKKHKLYDLGTDPEEIAALARDRFLAGEGRMETPEDEVLHAVKQRGYHGYHNSLSSRPGTVALFYTHPVQGLRKGEQDRPAKLVEGVRGVLSDDLRAPTYRGAPGCTAGHCYVASEALYHLLGGKGGGWTPQFVTHEGGPHWFLKHSGGRVLDPTSDQFSTPVPYDQGRGKGFLTALPSKRAQQVIERMLSEGAVKPEDVAFDKGEDDPEEAPARSKALEKGKLPMPAAPAHHHVVLPSGSTVGDKVKVTHQDGSTSWKQVGAGQILGQDPAHHPVSSREPNSR